MEHVNVLIASPGLNFDFRYIRSLMATIRELEKKKISYLWLSGYSSVVSLAREEALAGDLLWTESNAPLKGTVTYDKVFWIDSDITWTPEQFLKLYRSKKDIISGYYINYNSNNELISNIQDENFSNIHFEQMSEEDKKGAKPVEVSWIGLGFVAVRQGVFESLQRPWFRFDNLETEINNKTIISSLGEDITWCIRVKNEKRKLFVDPSVRVGHIKPRIIVP